MNMKIGADTGKNRDFEAVCRLRDNSDPKAIASFLTLHIRADDRGIFELATICLQQAGVAARNCGQPDRAQELYDQALTYASSRLGPGEVGKVKAGILLDKALLLMDTDPAQAEGLIRQVVNLRQQLDDRSGLIIAEVKLGHSLALQRNYRGASRVFGQAEVLLEIVSNREQVWFWEATLRYHQAQMAEARSKFGDAADYADQALRLHELHVEDQPHQKRHVELYALLARCYQADRQPDRANEFETKARRVLAEIADPTARERVRQLAKL